MTTEAVIKLEWMHKGIMSIPSSTKVLSPATDLIPGPTLLLYNM